VDAPVAPGAVSSQVGTVGAALTLPNGKEIDTLQYTLVDANGKTVKSGSIDISNSQSISFQIGDVPVGSGYGLTLQGTSDGGTTCSGSAAPLAVAAHATTTVLVNMACYASGPDAGNLLVNGTPYACATWTSLATGTTGAEAVAGSPITLVATATGPDPAALTYRWTSSNPIGTLGTDEAKGGTDTVSFMCQSPGTTTITLVVADGSVPDGGGCSSAQDTASITVSCDARVHGTQVLAGYITPAIAAAPFVAPLPPDTPMHLSIGLPVTDSKALAAFVSQVSTPGSPSYRQFLTPSQFTATYGPSDVDYQSIIDFATSKNLTIEKTYPNKLLVDVAGKASDVATAFYVNLNFYQRPDGTQFIAPDREPSLDATTPVLHVTGLDTYRVAVPGISPTTFAPQVGSGPGGFYQGQDFRNAYASCTSMTGSGQVLGLFELDGFSPIDVTTYESNTGLSVPVNPVLIGGFDGTPSGGQGSAEVAMDIEVAAAMAPGLDQIEVFEGDVNHVDSILNQMATQVPLPHTLSSSWTWSPIDDFLAQVLAEFAAQGQSFAQASMDRGAYPADPQDVRDEDNVTVVGGTELTMTGLGAAYASEAVWNNDPSDVSGGGILTSVPIPPYQQGIDMSLNAGSTTARNVPDIALVADGVLAVATFPSPATTVSVQGTSIAAPLWAAFVALANQRSALNGLGPIGFVNPLLYARAQSPLVYADAFHDVTVGNNDGFSAVQGYDLATGWGSPSCNLVDELAFSHRALDVTLSNINFHTTGFSVTSHNPTFDPVLGADANGNVTIRCLPTQTDNAISQSPQTVQQLLGCDDGDGFVATLTCEGTGQPGSIEIKGTLSLSITNPQTSTCLVSDPPRPFVSPSGSQANGTWNVDVDAGTPAAGTTGCSPVDPTTGANSMCVRFLDVCFGGTANIGDPNQCQRQEFAADVSATNVRVP
jgi:hypothetical protein